MLIEIEMFCHRLIRLKLICALRASRYMAPEIFEMQEYDAKADIWSVGCVFYEMLGNDDV